MTTLTPATLADILADSAALPFLRKEVPLDDMITLAKAVAPKQDAFGILRLAACEDMREGQAVLNAVLEILDPRQLVRFEAGCLALSADRWTALGYDPTVVYTALQARRTPDVKKLKAWQLLCKHPLDVTQYWTDAVTDAIKAKDWPAAWEALRVALIGHPKESTVPLQQLMAWNSFTEVSRVREQRVLFIPEIRTRGLVMEVFEAMAAEGLVALGPAELKQKATWLKLQNKGQTRLPGLLEACQFQRRAVLGRDWPVAYDETGRMILGLAEWASKQKKIVTETEADPTADAPATPTPKRAPRTSRLTLVGGS